MSRPRKHPNDLHDEQIKFYVKGSQKEELLKACGDFDKDQSALIREIFFDALRQRYLNIPHSKAI